MNESVSQFTIEQHPDYPIIIITGQQIGGSATDTIRAINQAVDNLLTQLDQPAYTIADLSQVSVGFMEIVQGMAAATRKEPGSMTDPRVIESVLVSESAMLQIASKAFGQNQYGALNVPIFPSADEALAYIQSRIEASASNDRIEASASNDRIEASASNDRTEASASNDRTEASASNELPD